jgi:hypothetical protein
MLAMCVGLEEDWAHASGLNAADPTRSREILLALFAGWEVRLMAVI